MVDPSRIRNGSVKPWSTLGQSSSNSGKCVPDHFSEVIWCGGPSSDWAGSVRAVSFCVSMPEKIPCVKWGYDSCPFFVWRFLAQGTSDKE